MYVSYITEIKKSIYTCKSVFLSYLDLDNFENGFDVVCLVLFSIKC